MSSGSFTIGQAAARAGISADTIRYYERIGVLPKPPRSAAGYRRYSDAHVGRMVFVRDAARFGFPLKELAGFLKSRDRGRPPCHGVRAAGDRLLAQLDRQIAELTAARTTMVRTLADWDRRLAATPAGTPARLLESLAGDQELRRDLEKNS
jgi:MerR family mercuric resistance operon transcriptional regulator